jgi:beta-xylosidase
MYYIFVTRPASEEWVLRSSTPFGPYERRILVVSIQGPLPMAGYAHHGGIVETKDGDWCYIGFMDAYPGGPIPVVAPIRWSNGWPSLVTETARRWGSPAREGNGARPRREP